MDSSKELPQLSSNGTDKQQAAGDGRSNEHGGRRLKYEMSRESFYKLFADIGRRQMAENPRPSIDNEVEYNSGLQHEQAMEALKYYKAEKGVDFELTEVVSASRAVFLRSHGFHLNFEAIPNYGIDRSSKKFFAELFWFHEGPKARSYKVTLCMILDPSSSDVTKGCPDCTDIVLHPKGVNFFCCPPELLQSSSGKNSEQMRCSGDDCETRHRPSG